MSIRPEHDVIKPTVAASGSKRVLFSEMIAGLVGYDIFISYAREDASTYGRLLTDELGVLGFRVFMDTSEMTVGELLSVSLRRAVRHSSMFVLLATPAALRSGWVREELRLAVAHRRKVVAVSFGAFQSTESDNPLRSLLGDRVWAEQPVEALDEAPGTAVLQHIVRAFQFTRRDTWRLRLLLGLTCLFLSLAAIAGVFAYLSSKNADEAVAQTLSVRQHLYVAHMGQIHQAWRQPQNFSERIERVRKLLGYHIPAEGKTDNRSFAWYYFWKMAHPRKVFRGLMGTPYAVTMSPDGDVIASGGGERVIRLWNVKDGT